MWDQQITIEEVNDPVEVERHRAHRERAQKNWDWLQDHWPDLLPQAHGKFLAVADQQPFVTETLEAALEWVRTNHPGDTGHIVEYVWPANGPRIYSGRLC
jgi:hypothetical protein